MLISLIGKAQNEEVLLHQKLGEKQLSHLHIYDVYFLEKTEQLYIATNEGIFFYRQGKFVKMQQPEQAIGTSFFEFKTDKLGILYCKNLNGQIFKIYENKINLYYSYNRKRVKHFFNYEFTANNDLICGSQELYFIKRNKTQMLSEQIFVTHATEVSSIMQLTENSFKYEGRTNFKGNLETAQLTESWKKNNKFKFEKLCDSMMVTNAYKIGKSQKFIILNNFDEHKKGIVCLTDRDGTKIDCNEVGEYRTMVNLTDSLYLLLSSTKGAKLVEVRNNKLKVSTPIFENEFISKAHLTSKGVLILSTFNKGLIIIPNIKIKGNYNLQNYKQVVSYTDTSVAVTSSLGEVFHKDLISGKFSLVFADKNKISKKLFVSKWEHNSSKLLPRLLLEDYKAGCDLDNGFSALIKWKAITIAQSKNTNINTKLKTPLKSNTLGGIWSSIVADKEGETIYTGCSNGLYQKKYYDKSLEQIDSSYNISELQFYKGELYLGTANQGIVVYKDLKFKKVVNANNGLNSNKIYKFEISDSIIYIRTDKGIQAFSLLENKVLDFGFEYQFLNNEVTDFSLSKSNLNFVAQKHFYFIPKSELFQGFDLSKVYIDSIFVNENLIDESKNNFEYDENHLSFKIDYRELQNLQKVKLEYRLIGLNSKWKTLPENNYNIEYSSLPNGTFTLEVRALTNGKYSKSKTYKFTILKPYWKKWWFYLLVITLICVSIYTYVRYVTKRIKKKAEQELEVETNKRIAVNAQLKAIRAQMNPHFIFNAINSIQDLVLRKKTIKSYDYLEAFSRLVRTTLDHSEREYVTLKEEIKFLELYLSLESLRFDNNFEKSIEVKNINQNIVIPSLIVQPFIENALKHGLLHKLGSKKLQIIFEKENSNRISCMIIDNGVGRKEAERIISRRGNKHSSFSTNAIKNRLNILAEEMNEECYYEIIDLKNNNEPIGTKVKLVLPIKHMVNIHS